MAKYLVELDRPVGVTHAEMVTYIRQEVASSVGGMDPTELIIKLDYDSVKVKVVR